MRVLGMTTLLALAIPLSSGCKKDSEDSAGDSSAAQDTQSGTPAGSDRLGDISAEVSEVVHTVATVSWTSTESLRALVEYGTDESLGLSTALSAEGTSHEQVLLGLPPGTTIYYEVVTEDGSERSGVGSFETTALPSGWPSLSVTGSGHDGWMVTTMLGAITGPIILDAEGNYVWYWPEERELDVYRARLSVDGTGVVYNAASVSGDPSEDSELVKVSFDGTEVSTLPITLLAHDFVEHSDGTYGVIVVEDREENGETVRGNRIVEFGPDGSETEIWNSWNCFSYEEDQGDDPELGWTFANAMDYDEASETYYLSLRNISSIASIDRGTGSCNWILGGESSTLEFSGSSGRFLHQHQFEVSGNEILIFDNEGASSLEARVLEYELDLDSNTATEIGVYQTDPAAQSFVLGDVSRLANEDLMVTWSVAGQINRLSSSGETLWQLNSDLGYAFGFNTHVADLYTQR